MEEKGATLKADHATTPRLAVALIEVDPTSQVYKKAPGKMTVEVDTKSVEHRMDTDVFEADLLQVVQQLNDDPSISVFWCNC